MRGDACIVCALLAALGCARREPPPLPSAPPEPPPADWARRVVPASHVAPVSAERHDVHRAVMDDATEASRAHVSARRLVYRVGFSVPPSFRERRAEMVPAATELEVDLSVDRARARFVGTGWPLPTGTEVRLRADLPGVYVFDERGGRSLGAGELAAWFEGKRAGASRSNVRVLRETGAPGDEVSAPLCALIAEWTAQEREDVGARCAGGSIPPAFAFGPWRAELTAMVPMTLPGRALRADEGDPPPRILPEPGGTTLSPDDLARIVSARGVSDDIRALGDLEVDNRHGDARAIVLVDGVPIGWVEAGVTTRFAGLRGGMHRIGALRPLGAVRAPARALAIPGRLVIGRPRARVATGALGPPGPAGDASR